MYIILNLTNTIGSHLYVDSNEQNSYRGMDTKNRLTAVGVEGFWGTGWKKVKGLGKIIYIYIKHMDTTHKYKQHT